MQTIDRYVVRQIIPPFLLALGLFTFVLAINPMLDYAKLLLAKGVPVPTVGLLLLTLVPQALSLTVPMSFLTGALMGLGRISGDRESVALLACGVSPFRVLRPILVFALIVAAGDMYILQRVKPDANQLFREITFSHLAEHTAADIKPRVFFQQFPGKVLLVGSAEPGGGWSDVLIADTTDPDQPGVTLAETGKLLIDREERQVRLVLGSASQYTAGKTGTRVYTTTYSDPVVLKITAESVFGSGDTAYPRGYAEKSYAELRRDADDKIKQGLSPHNEILHMQQMFSFPVACLVFALLAVPLGLNTRKEGRLAALAVGLAIIASYYLLMQVAEGWVKGEAWNNGAAAGGSLPAIWARWVPNIVLGLIGLVALWWSARTGHANPLPSLSLFLPRRAAADVADSATQPRSKSAPVVVVRMPAFPMPRLLDRYVTGHYLRMAGLAFVALLMLFYIGEAVDLAEKVFKGQAGMAMLLSYLWHATPQFVAFVVPLAVLVAVLGTMGALTRSGELMVMRASGVSLYRAALPLLACAVVWAGVLFFLEERVLGQANQAAQDLRSRIRSGRPIQTIDTARLNWIVGEDGLIYHYASIEPPSRLNANKTTLNGLSIYETLASPYRLARHTFAARATFEGGAWRAQAGWMQAFGDSGSRQEFDRITMTKMPSPDDFQRAQIDPARMSYRELRDYVRRLGASGFSVAEQSVDLHRRLAFPAVTIVMTLLAIPFGVTTGKKGALYGIGLAAVLAGAYMLLATLFMAVGAAGILPPFLAAWAPNLLFACGALFLMFTVRT